MALSNGPNLGLLIKGTQGDLHYTELMTRWRGLDSIIQAHSVEMGLLEPPGGTPADGATYIVGRGETFTGLAWTRTTNVISLTWPAHGLSVGMGFRVVVTSSAGAVSLANYTVTGVTSVDIVEFTGINGGDASGTVDVFQLPFGAWAGHVDKFARYVTGTGWEFFTTKQGWIAGARDSNALMMNQGEARGWRNLLADLERNVRSATILNLVGLAAYQMTADEAACAVVYVLGDQDCTITYPAAFDGTVPAYIFISAEFYGYTLGIEQESSASTRFLDAGASKFYSFGPGIGMADMFDGTKKLTRGQTNGVVDLIANYVAGLADAGKVYRFNSASALDFEIDATENHLENATMRVLRQGAGTVTIIGSNGATIYGNTAPSVNQMITICRDGVTDNWYCG